MAKIKIKDDSGDRNYFTIVPNYILNHSTHTDQALYLQMKRYAGEDGKCFATQETLAKKLGVGRWAYNKSLKYLISRGWVEYIGMTGGKTRPIKTYKINNIWQENNDYYKKIPTTLAVSKKDSVSISKDTDQISSKIPSILAIEEEHIYKKNQEEDIAETSSALISEVIKLFEVINPACKKLYGNTTQRKAATDLIETYSFERVKSVIQNTLPKTNNMSFFPNIATPLQLRDKWSSLESAVVRWKQEKKKEKVGIIY